MAPVPRCDLRLPSEPNDGRRSPHHSSPRAKADDQTSSPGGSYTSAQPVRKAGSGRESLHSQRSATRDSAEILERAPGFSTGVTRDAGEVRDHRLHAGETVDADGDPVDGSDAAAASGGLAEDGGPAETGGPAAGSDSRGEVGADGVDRTQCPTPCATLEESRSDVEAAAAAAVDDEDATSVGSHVPTEAVATPGDVCARFCDDRPESPSSGYSLRKAIGADKMAKARRSGPTKCKGTYASLETYEGLWGSSKAVGARKKLELEMRKKRKYYERLHERNKRRREKERRRAKEKRRMLRCRDQSKIPESVGDISINKAFYFRFNYNQRLPFLPSSMDQHLRRFKRPPFRRYQKGSRPCHKLVDEFEKLRVFDSKGDPKKASRSSAETGRKTSHRSAKVGPKTGQRAAKTGPKKASHPPAKAKA